jgi:anti-sigma factor RsiW
MTDRDMNDRLLRLNAALDGELDAMASLKFEREMRDDPAFAAEYRRLAALRDAVRRHAPREAAPQALADRIAALAGSAPLAETAATGSTVVPFQRRAWFDRRALALAASLAVLGFAVGAGVTSLRTTSLSDSVAQGLVSDFARSQIAGQPFDVASSDRHTVKPWLAAHATISAEIVDLAQAGFALEGGRIAVVDRVPAPTLVYRKREHLIAVTELPAAMAGSQGGGAIETIDGFHVARWSDANLNYVAVSDIDEKDLAAFAEAFRAAQKPPGESPAR